MVRRCCDGSDCPLGSAGTGPYGLAASRYSVRAACAAPSLKHASCLALELVPTAPAARAHSRPVGMPRTSTARNVAEVCRPPTPEEGCYGLRAQDLHSGYLLATTAPSEQKIALIDAYD